jgi:hypothetical protein
MTYHIVKFHADGGQMCVPGIRCFTDKAKADELAEYLRTESGHSCGLQSVQQCESERPIENDGIIYPGVANMGRDTLGECYFRK